MAVAKHQEQLQSNHPAEKEIDGRATLQSKLDAVSKHHAITIRRELMAVFPIRKRTPLLDIDKQPISDELGMDRNPGDGDRPNKHPEDEPRADLQASFTADHLNLLPRGDEVGEDVFALMKRENFLYRGGNSRTKFETHCKLVGSLCCWK